MDSATDGHFFPQNLYGRFAVISSQNLRARKPSLALAFDQLTHNLQIQRRIILTDRANGHAETSFHFSKK